jgi:hypothetical protein
MVRHYALSADDLALVSAKRTEATQFGFAMMLLYLRYPGRVLAAGESPPAPIVAFVARQLGVSKGAFAAYGQRDETRRKHLIELMHDLRFQSFSQAASCALIAQLTPAAQADPRPGRRTARICVLRSARRCRPSHWCRSTARASLKRNPPDRFVASGIFVGPPEQHVAMAGQGSAPADEIATLQLMQRLHQIAL